VLPPVSAAVLACCRAAACVRVCLCFREGVGVVLRERRGWNEEMRGFLQAVPVVIPHMCACVSP